MFKNYFGNFKGGTRLTQRGGGGQIPPPPKHTPGGFTVSKVCPELRACFQSP